MKDNHGYITGALLIIGLFFGTGQIAFGSNNLPTSIPDSCSNQLAEQAIPDDGSWLKICWSDPSAPEGSTITKVHLKYAIDHPKPEQLEISLSRDVETLGQVIWDRGALIQGDKLGEAADLDIFNGAPSQGNWCFWIRDTVPGEAGKFEAFTIRPVYAPVEPVPELLSGSPGEPTSFRIPPDAVKSTTPDQDPEKPTEKGNIVQSMQHVDIKSETFEGVFPNTGWTSTDANPNDGKEFLWDDDDYRHHNGYWAAWPANGGANWKDPASSPYPPNMASWMIYGPFDLSTAASAETSFWLWRQVEANYDYLFFGVSHDGSTFTGTTWSGTAGWEQEHIDMSSYVGDSSVWVGWLFFSDGSVQYEGPWVDGILISKEVPGTVTVSGTLSYYDRNAILQIAPFTKVSLYDDDPGGTDDFLASTYTNSSGVFSFAARTNWDGDTDADPSNRNLDLYLVFEAFNYDLYPTYHRVTNFAGQTHKWTGDLYENASDGSLNMSFPIPFSHPAKPAMWIFQDLQRAWETVYNGTSPSINPGSVTAKWEYQQNCYPTPSDCKTRFIPSGPYIFIQDQSALSKDTVVHEVGHNYIYNANGWTYGCSHDIFMVTDINCAWSEGWADFLPLVVNYVSGSGDTCYDKGIGPCSGTPDSSHYNLEMHSRNDNPAYFPWGDNVEGRVAGALYDLYDDSANEGYDSAYFPPKPLDPITKIVLQGPLETSFSQFWNSWKASGYNKHHAVRAIYQNTIDYNTLPTMVLPDWNVPHDSSWNNAFSLYSYSSDAESSLTELTWQIISVSGSNCSVTIDSSKNIDITQTTFPGACDVTVRVSDSIGTRTDVFRVTVTQASFSDVPTSYWAYTQIEKVFANGITSGCYPDPRRYCPTGNVTRAQMAIFLLKGIHGGGYNPPPATGTMFYDVPSSYWAAAWIEQLAREGITSGCGGGNYCPENPVPRDQMAVFMVLTFNLP